MHGRSPHRFGAVVALGALALLATCDSNNSRAIPAGTLPKGAAAGIIVELQQSSLRKMAFVVRGASLAVTGLFGVDFKLKGLTGARLSQRSVTIGPGCFMAADTDQNDPETTHVVLGALGTGGVLSGDLTFGTLEFDLAPSANRSQARNPNEIPLAVVTPTTYLGGAPILQNAGNLVPITVK